MKVTEEERKKERMKQTEEERKKERNIILIQIKFYMKENF